MKKQEVLPVEKEEVTIIMKRVVNWLEYFMIAEKLFFVGFVNLLSVKEARDFK